jgi:three-Cys-motif partner protein
MYLEAAMSESSDDFFEGKRTWSKIKDEVLEKYMTPYLAKVKTRGQRILLIDGFAGPGVFEDGTHGSPLIMCEKAEERAKGNYHAIFINNKRKYHDKLRREIQQRGWSNSAEPRLGDTQIVLQEFLKTLKDQTVFLYLDPFGPTGCNFDLLMPFLKRSYRFSTEILLTMNMPGMHRLAARHVNEIGREDEEAIRANRQKLTNVFGGDYWKDILWSDDDAEKREIQLIAAYQKKLAEHFSYTRSCPVREGTGKRIKYFIVFASRHQDALVLLNDIMVNAYFAGMHQADLGGGLWGDSDWREMRSIDDLDRVILDTVTKHPGETRKLIWFRIVDRHFMRYLKSEYIAMVKLLLEAKKLSSPTFLRTNRLNEDSILIPYQ